jgi:hypothetical protein
MNYNSKYGRLCSQQFQRVAHIVHVLGKKARCLEANLISHISNYHFTPKTLYLTQFDLHSQH